MNMKNELMAKLPANPMVAGLIGLLIVGLLGAGINIYFVARHAGQDQQYLALTSELRVLSQQLSTASRNATNGEAPAFEQLKNSRAEFDKTLKTLTQGGDGLPALSGTQLNELNSLWTRVGGASETIVKNRERVLFLHDVAKTLNDSIPELQQEYNNVVEVLANTNAPADQVALAQRQSWLAERIARNVDKMLEGQSDAPQAADQFNLDASTFGSVLQGML